MSAPTVPPDSNFKERPESEKILDKGFVGLTTAFAIAIGLILLLIALVIFIRALPAIQSFGLGFLTSSAWNPVRGREEFGVLPVIYGTLVSSLIALLIAVPLGIGSAIFLSEDFIPLNARTILVFLVQLLAAIPSVVYGLWGIFVLIPILRPLGNWLNANFSWIPLFSTPLGGPGMLPAGVILAIMILPIIIAISRDSLAALPPDLRQASLGLGATRWETIFRVLIPAAFSGIVGGIMLALGRALGETMAVTMIIGNSNRISASILAPANTIASLLANQFAEASGMQVSALMYAGFVLLVLTLVVNIFAELIVNRVKAKY
ncbi:MULTISPECIES: phosphate ABC transporter permease subunit PstC [Microcystis]|jgi:phosphate transport system permease protein|uniref:Phosphate transport system permease protein n=1 Tax=Microcystis aeruginosa Ma_QC_C_20070703_M131 TaxID=2486263 RepID=A0A551YDH6_MICAE|nr:MULTISPECIES: phosphate ABC transporter permease subunit PstC [Microcystis]TRT58996.1 MAG: phosphate ABC transporter permease subunit PstC [Microcystis aeruginosa Ma_QC_C_20070703_M131]AVQ73468.1 phosphate ABC transporter permease subunit PstC [Microcystis sp. MC19]MDB9390932.1 phosphate ABC transporter permease subunit PstC [Microcystis aeruginosa CS-579]CCI30337.1 high-affinity phosphate transport protein (ABC superfamily, membrane) [Microcystis sp. T1-4]GCA83901.1 phosphate transport sys